MLADSVFRCLLFSPPFLFSPHLRDFTGHRLLQPHSNSMHDVRFEVARVLCALRLFCESNRWIFCMQEMDVSADAGVDDEMISWDLQTT
jgi:hypothetical protein